MTDISIIPPGKLPDGMVDAFGRLRVSEPALIYDIKQLHDKQPLLVDEKITNTSGNATSTHSVTDAATTMYVEAGDIIIRQTKTRYNYRPGKSQLAFMTGVIGTPATGLTRRLGLFTATDGVFFESAPTELAVVVRKDSSDTRVVQSSWNLDKMDGTGPSGITLDASKAQIFVVDYEWLGVGRVRFGLVIDGTIYYVHEANHANSVTSVYMSTPNQPVRYEIASTTGTGSLVHICSSVISEGASTLAGVLRSYGLGTNHVDCDAAGSTYAIIGVRLKSTWIDAAIEAESISLLSLTNDAFHWYLCLNPTIAGTFTYADLDAASPTQVASGATTNTVSDLGTVLQQGVSASASDIAARIETLLHLGSSIDGVSDEVVLCAQPFGSNANITGTMTWRELT